MAAGPSSSTGPSKEQLAEAENHYEEGMTSLRANDLDKAVELLGDALQKRIAAFGDLAPECASAYHHYGTAIFYKAQEEQDVFGAPLQQAAAEAQEEEEEAKEQENGAAIAEGANKENVDEKGKAPLRAEDIEAAEEADAEYDDADDEDDAKEGDAGDMQLAWEMLEVARSIYSKMGDEKALALADVHVLLGDIGMEEERFDSSATDYEAALQLLTQALEADDRRIAEAHYKLALTLHFLEDPEKALQHAKKAVSVCTARIARLSAAPGADGIVAGLSADAAAKEIEDLRAVLEDLAAKVEDLEAAVREKEATRKTLRDAFAHVAGSYSGGSASGSAGQSSSGPPAGPTTSAVVNLGVIGRGSKRINVQPVAAGTSHAGTEATGLGPAPQKPKRSFEDIMGSGAATSLGFGAPVTVPQGFGAPAAAPAAADAFVIVAGGDAQAIKKPKAENGLDDKAGAAPAGEPDPGAGKAAAAPSSIPAFLQAGQVAKTYGQATPQPPAAEN